MTMRPILSAFVLAALTTACGGSPLAPSASPAPPTASDVPAVSAFVGPLEADAFHPPDFKGPPVVTPSSTPAPPEHPAPDFKGPPVVNPGDVNPPNPPAHAHR
jgi:hypothetical protein